MMERHNRKSHLAPQLSPSTQALLRGEGISSPSKESSALKTPTSGEIPIGGGDDMKASPALDMCAAQRALPIEINGTNMYPTPPSSYERPLFPPRTSSSSAVLSNRSRESEVFSSVPTQIRSRDTDNINASTVLQTRPRDPDAYISPIVLPIRPAPPTGPLPAPPGSTGFRASTLRRQATNGLAYPNGEQPQY